MLDRSLVFLLSESWEADLAAWLGLVRGMNWALVESYQRVRGAKVVASSGTVQCGKSTRSCSRALVTASTLFFAPNLVNTFVRWNLTVAMLMDS